MPFWNFRSRKLYPQHLSLRPQFSHGVHALPFQIFEREFRQDPRAVRRKEARNHGKEQDAEISDDLLRLDLYSSRYVILGGIVGRGGYIEDSYRVEEPWELTTTAVVAHF